VNGAGPQIGTVPGSRRGEAKARSGLPFGLIWVSCGRRRGSQGIASDIVPDKWNLMSIEPGVKQESSFNTRINEKYRFIVARACGFRYDAFTPHGIEREFETRHAAR
jgi:hypothetical protein